MLLPMVVLVHKLTHEPQVVFNFGGSNEVHPLDALNGYNYGVKDK